MFFFWLKAEKRLVIVTKDIRRPPEKKAENTTKSANDHNNEFEQMICPMLCEYSKEI